MEKCELQKPISQLLNALESYFFCVWTFFRQLNKSHNFSKIIFVTSSLRNSIGLQYVTSQLCCVIVTSLINRIVCCFQPSPFFPGGALSCQQKRVSQGENIECPVMWLIRATNTICTLEYHFTSSPFPRLFRVWRAIEERVETDKQRAQQRHTASTHVFCSRARDPPKH